MRHIQYCGKITCSERSPEQNSPQNLYLTLWTLCLSISVAESKGIVAPWSNKQICSNKNSPWREEDLQEKEKKCRKVPENWNNVKTGAIRKTRINGKEGRNFEASKRKIEFSNSIIRFSIGRCKPKFSIYNICKVLHVYNHKHSPIQIQNLHKQSHLCVYSQFNLSYLYYCSFRWTYNLWHEHSININTDNRMIGSVFYSFRKEKESFLL